MALVAVFIGYVFAALVLLPPALLSIWLLPIPLGVSRERPGGALYERDCGHDGIRSVATVARCRPRGLFAPRGALPRWPLPLSRASLPGL